MFEHAATGLLNTGGVSNKLPGLVAKQQVAASLHNNMLAHSTITNHIHNDHTTS